MRQNTHVKKIKQILLNCNVSEAEKFDKDIREYILNRELDSIPVDIYPFLEENIDIKYTSKNPRRRRKQLNDIKLYYEHNERQWTISNNLITALATIGTFFLMLYGIFDIRFEFAELAGFSINNIVYAAVFFVLFLLYLMLNIEKLSLNRKINMALKIFSNEGIDIYILLINLLYYSVCAIFDIMRKLGAEKCLCVERMYVKIEIAILIVIVMYFFYQIVIGIKNTYQSYIKNRQNI